MRAKLWKQPNFMKAHLQTFFFEELSEQFPTFLIKYPSMRLHLMIQTAVSRNSIKRSCCTSPQIVGSKEKPGKSGENNCSSTHRTRLKGNVKAAPIKPFLGQVDTCITNSHDLSMLYRYPRLFGLISSAPDYCFILHHNSANRRLVTPETLFSQAQRFSHISLMFSHSCVKLLPSPYIWVFGKTICVDIPGVSTFLQRIYLQRTTTPE